MSMIVYLRIDSKRIITSSTIFYEQFLNKNVELLVEFTTPQYIHGFKVNIIDDQHFCIHCRDRNLL